MQDYSAPPKAKTELADRLGSFSTSVLKDQASTRHQTSNYQLVLGLINQLVLLDPRHHVTQLTTDGLNWMHRIQTTTSSH